MDALLGCEDWFILNAYTDEGSWEDARAALGEDIGPWPYPPQSQAQSQGKPDSRVSGAKPAQNRPSASPPRDYMAELSKLETSMQVEHKAAKDAETARDTENCVSEPDGICRAATELQKQAAAAGRDSAALKEIVERIGCLYDMIVKLADKKIDESPAGQIKKMFDGGKLVPLEYHDLPDEAKLGTVYEAIIIYMGDGSMDEPRIWMRPVELDDAKALAERIAKQYVPDDGGKPVQVLNLKPDKAA